MRTRRLWLFWIGVCVVLTQSACVSRRGGEAVLTAMSTRTPRSSTVTPLLYIPTPLPTLTSLPTISTPARPTDTPDTPDTPTAVAASIQTSYEFQVEAWLSRPNIASGDEQTVYGRLTRGGVGVAGAQMYSFVCYSDAKLRSSPGDFKTAGADGIVSSTLLVRDGTAGRTVYVDVYLIDEHTVYRKTTLFLTEG